MDKPHLTPREIEIVRLLCDGLPIKQVAHHLHRSHKTVEHHVTSIMRKVDVHDRVSLVRWAIRKGIVEP